MADKYADLVFALDACTIIDPSTGLKIRLSPGEAWWASDPIVKARPELFNRLPVTVRGVPSQRKSDSSDSPIENATANPGVKRQVKKS